MIEWEEGSGNARLKAAGLSDAQILKIMEDHIMNGDGVGEPVGLVGMQKPRGRVPGATPVKAGKKRKRRKSAARARLKR